MKAEAAGMEILKLCVDAGGCLTGEHGVGIEKRDLMLHQFTETDLNQQMRVRAAFDPGWLLNPSKVFPLDLEDAPKPGNQSSWRQDRHERARYREPRKKPPSRPRGGARERRWRSPEAAPSAASGSPLPAAGRCRRRD
jgi:hypothetical protein